MEITPEVMINIEFEKQKWEEELKKQEKNIKFNDLIDQSGFPTEKGKLYLLEFESILTELFKKPVFKNASEQDLRSLGAVLTKMVGNKISIKNNKNL